jgi:hypothetical protein
MPACPCELAQPQAVRVEKAKHAVVRGADLGEARFANATLRLGHQTALDESRRRLAVKKGAPRPLPRRYRRSLS